MINTFEYSLFVWSSRTRLDSRNWCRNWQPVQKQICMPASTHPTCVVSSRFQSPCSPLDFVLAPLARDGCGQGVWGWPSPTPPHPPHTCPSCPLDRVIHHTKSAFGGKPEFGLPLVPPSSFPSWHFEKEWFSLSGNCAHVLSSALSFWRCAF